MSAEALIVIVAGSRYALPMERVIEVRQHMGATRVPGAPAWVCGIVERQDAPVEVLDAARRLDAHGPGNEVRRCLVFIDMPGKPQAMLVDDLGGLVTRRSIDGQCPIRRDLVAGMIDENGAAVALIDVDAFFGATGEVP